MFLMWLVSSLAKELSPEEVMNVCPSRNTLKNLKNLMVDAAVDAMLDVSTEIEACGNVAF